MGGVESVFFDRRAASDIGQARYSGQPCWLSVRSLPSLPPGAV
jgi:hypothetical protein